MCCEGVLKRQQCCKEALSRGELGVTEESVGSLTPDHKVLLGESSLQELQEAASELRLNGWHAGDSWLLMVARVFGLCFFFADSGKTLRF